MLNHRLSFILWGWVVFPVGLIALAGAARGQFLVTNPGSGTIGEYNLDGTPVNPALISGLSGYPEGMAIAISTSHLYVANFSSGTIGEYNLDGTPVNPALVSGLNEPSCIALSGSSLYVTNFGSGTIGQYNLDGALVNPADLGARI